MAPKPAASARPNVTPSVAANDPNCDFYAQTGHSVCGAIRNEYNNYLGGPGGPLGYPTSDELTSPDGVGKFNTFQNAGDHIYWSPATGAAEIGGAIFDHWGQFGYELGPLGYPTSDELPLGGGAQSNTFQGGPVITWSPATGACEIGGDIYIHWVLTLKATLGPLGLPTSDEITNPDGVGKRNTFQYGGDSIYWSPATGAQEIGGSIFQHWGDFGYETGPLGYPTSDEITNPDGVGKRNSFQNGGDHIYWSPATGNQEIGGAIFDHWGNFGFETGPLGYPISDEITNPDGVGKHNSFQNAGDHIYWSPTTGAQEIGGAIFDHWGTSGYETGPLGYPTTDEVVTPDGTRRYNNFVGGSIVWSPSDGAITKLYPVESTLPTNPQPGSYGSYSMDLPVQGGVWTTQQVASEVVNHIDQYFTFTGCGPTLYVGKTCDLDTDIGVAAPIQVIAINSTGFAVKSLPGHPEGAGRTITFIFEANDVPGNLGLETLHVDAFGPLSNTSLLGPLNTEGTARPSWTIFANNISSRLPANPPPPGGVGPLVVPAKPMAPKERTR